MNCAFCFYAAPFQTVPAEFVINGLSVCKDHVDTATADNPYLQEVPTPPRMRFDHYGARDDDENPMCGCGYKPETRTPDFAVELVAAHIRKETR